jgi:hypothetical protein
MTRTMLRDVLSALAAATLVSAVPGGAALAQGKSLKTFHAEVAMDAVRGAKAKTAMTAKQPSSPSNANSQNWRWFQDYGGGSRFSQPSVQKGLSLSDDQ